MFVKGKKYHLRSEPTRRPLEFIGYSENKKTAVFLDSSLNSFVRNADGTAMTGKTAFDVVSDEMTENERKMLIKLFQRLGYTNVSQALSDEGGFSHLADKVLNLLRDTYGRKE